MSELLFSPTATERFRGVDAGVDAVAAVVDVVDDDDVVDFIDFLFLSRTVALLLSMLVKLLLLLTDLRLLLPFFTSA